MRVRPTFVIILCLLGTVLPQPSLVHAAHLFVDPTASSMGAGDTIYVPIRIDTQGACINAAHVALAYDPSVLSVQDIATGDSIFTLWTITPTIEREGTREVGKVVLEGGVPGGYCGRVDGDPGITNILAKLVVTTNAVMTHATVTVSSSLILLPETQVILHDGLGTLAERTLQGSDLVIHQATGTPSNTWISDVKSDLIAPELFEITLVEGPSVGNNKHYIVFSTVDKQSGIDHYEILETDPDRFGLLTWVTREAHWVRGESPYILRDQKLSSKIMVKAVDKNGNERIVEYTPPMSPLTELSRPIILIPTLILIALVLLVIYFMRRRRQTQPLPPHEP